jgi:predicted ester cyclase
VFDVEQATRDLFALIDEMQSGKTSWTRFDELVTADFKAYVPGQVLDAVGFKSVMQTFAAGFSVSSHTVLDLVAGPSTAAVREVWQGVHTGSFLGAEPTGKSVSVLVMALVKFKDGKLSEFHETFDTLALMQETGVIRA